MNGLTKKLIATGILLTALTGFSCSTEQKKISPEQSYLATKSKNKKPQQINPDFLNSLKGPIGSQYNCPTAIKPYSMKWYDETVNYFGMQFRFDWDSSKK